MYSSWYYNSRLACLQWIIMGRTYQVSEKENESYVLYRTDPGSVRSPIGIFPTIGEAIALAEADGKDLIHYNL